MNFKKYIYIFLFLFSLQYIFAMNNYNDLTIQIGPDNSIQSLNRDWYFSMDLDSLKLHDNSNLNEWYKCNPTGSWHVNLQEASNFTGTGVFKIPIIFTDADQCEVGLFLPLFYGKTSVYFNEDLIYNSSYENIPSKPYLLKLNLTQIREKNYITIKTQSSNKWGGTSGFIEIGNYKKIHQKWIKYLIKNISLGFISLFISIYFLIMFTFRIKEKYNLLFSGFSFSISLFIMGYYGILLYIFNYSWAYWLLTFLGAIGMYLLPILFFNSFLNTRIKIAGKILIIFYLFSSTFLLIEFLFTGKVSFYNNYLYVGVNFSYILVVIYIMTNSIKAIINKLVYAKMMFWGVILLAISFIYSILAFTSVISKPPIIGEGFFLMTLVFAIVLAKRAAQTHSDLEFAHADLEFTNAENVALNDTLEEKVEERTLELREKNAEITQSIEYSALIQNSMLPSEEQLSKVFSDHYAVWRPKDTVGGDFYWFKQLEEGFLIAIIDCTGHGVPGALLTMTATAALERIVSHINSTDPGLMLKEMNKILKGLLSQDNPYDIKDDGLDIGLCYFNTTNKKLTFSGSKIRLFVDNDGNIYDIKGDRQGIGYKRSKSYYSYTNHVIDVTENTTFHMTTDGFPDQSGGDKSFGFGWTKFIGLLNKHRGLPLASQVEKFEKELLDYQGDASQRDDITLLGFKIKVD